jgi:hypothetical protein
MRPPWLALLLMCAAALAQNKTASPTAPKQAAPKPGVGTDWRRSFLALPGQPPATASVQDLDRLERDLRLAASYCLAVSPGDFGPADVEANREVARRVTSYLAAVNLMAQDPRMRAAYNRAFLAASALPCVASFAPAQPPDAAAPVPAATQAAPPPFTLQAPALENVPERDKRTARELQDRYESAAARAAAAWQSAETLRQNLAARGMALNTQTAASVARVQLFLGQSEEALRGHDWEEAGANLERAEAETEKILKTTGR